MDEPSCTGKLLWRSTGVFNSRRQLSGNSSRLTRYVFEEVKDDLIQVQFHLCSVPMSTYVYISLYIFIHIYNIQSIYVFQEPPQFMKHPNQWKHRIFCATAATFGRHNHLCCPRTADWKSCTDFSGDCNKPRSETSLSSPLLKCLASVHISTPQASQHHKHHSATLAAEPFLAAHWHLLALNLFRGSRLSGWIGRTKKGSVNHLFLQRKQVNY